MQIRELDLDAWLATVEQSGLPTGPFNSPLSVEIWWRHHGQGRRFVGLVGYRAGCPVAALPLYAAFFGRVLRPVGFGVAAELEVATQPGCLAEFVGEVVTWCAARSPALALDLLDVRIPGPLWAAVGRLGPRCVPSYPCLVVDIEGDWWNRLKKKRRHEIRRTVARLGEHGTVAHRFATRQDAHDLPGLFDQCVNLHSTRTAHRMDSSGFSRSPRSAFYREFFLRQVAAGQAALSCLLLDGQVISFFAGVVNGPTFVAMLTAFDERYATAAPGHVNIFHMVGALNASGFRACDLSKGWQAYKARWSTESYDLHHVVVPLRNDALARCTLGPLLTLKDRGRALGVNEKTRSVIELFT